VTNELKKEGTVYFVEKNKVGLPRIEMKKVEENVITLTPYFPVDYRLRYRIAVINNLYYKWLFRCLKEKNNSFDLVITFDFTAPEIHKHFKNIIFYSADENVGLGRFTPKFVTSYHTRKEKEVAEKSKLCIVTSEYMLSKIRKYNESTFFIPLGAPEITQPVTFNKKKAQIPVLGLVGYLDKNMDYRLLRRLLKKFRIIFIGPISEKAKKDFLEYPNAEFVGVKTGDELYRLLQTIDVCIAPYDISIINKGLTPNKLWLYLAVGKPVVVTDIPNIRNWEFKPKLIYRCTNDRFGDMCMLAHDEDNIDLVRARREIAKDNSWNKRVEKIKQLFDAQPNENSV
jgi:glycosyltransferase involved in cell wall biosynthesis